MLRNMTLAVGVLAAAALLGGANAAPLAPGASLTAGDATILVPAKAKKGKKMVGKGKGGKGHAHRHRHGRDVGVGIGLGIFGAILCAESGDC